MHTEVSTISLHITSYRSPIDNNIEIPLQVL